MDSFCGAREGSRAFLGWCFRGRGRSADPGRRHDGRSRDFTFTCFFFLRQRSIRYLLSGIMQQLVVSFHICLFGTVFVALKLDLMPQINAQIFSFGIWSDSDFSL